MFHITNFRPIFNRYDEPLPLKFISSVIFYKEKKISITKKKTWKENENKTEKMFISHISTFQEHKQSQRTYYPFSKIHILTS